MELATECSSRAGGKKWTLPDGEDGLRLISHVSSTVSCLLSENTP